jgi:Flp pilus assembly protein TadD
MLFVRKITGRIFTRNHSGKRTAKLLTRKITGKIISAAACIMMLTLPMIWEGCGSDDDEISENVTLRVRKKPDTKRGVGSTSSSAVKRDSRSIEATGPAEVTGIMETEDAVSSQPEPPKKVSYQEAEAAYLEGNYPEAVELFTQYTECKPENPWGYYMLGLSSWKAENYQQAEDSFNRALQLDPDHVKSLLNLSRVYLDTGKSEEALSKIDKALQIDLESGVAFRLMGRAYRQMGETDKAVNAYRRAVLMDNNDAWAMNNLGLIFIREGQFEKALPPLARAVTLKDDIAIFQNNLGIALENTGNFRAAEKAYASAIAIDGEYDKAYNNLTRVEVLEETPGHQPPDLSAVAENYIREINASIDTLGSKTPLHHLAEKGIHTAVNPDSASSAEDISAGESEVTQVNDPIVITEADSTGSKKE